MFPCPVPCCFCIPLSVVSGSCNAYVLVWIPGGCAPHSRPGHDRPRRPAGHRPAGSAILEKRNPRSLAAAGMYPRVGGAGARPRMPTRWMRSSADVAAILHMSRATHLLRTTGLPHARPSVRDWISVTATLPVPLQVHTSSTIAIVFSFTTGSLGIIRGPRHSIEDMCSRQIPPAKTLLRYTPRRCNVSGNLRTLRKGPV